MSFYDYFTRTYDGKMLEERAADGPMRGRPRSTRVPYRPEANRPGCRIIRAEDHEMNLHFIGRWFPRADDPNLEYYGAQMLLLLSPWRCLEDLRGNHPTFHAAFAYFKLHTASPRDLRVIDNIQYFYQCSDRAADRREEEQTVDPTGDVPMPDAGDTGLPTLPEPSEQDIQRARQEKYAAREHFFGEAATALAKTCGIFNNVYPAHHPDALFIHEKASSTDMETFAEWGARIAAWSRTRPTHNAIPGTADIGAVLAPTHQAAPAVDQGAVIDVTPASNTAPAIVLNTEQQRAHNIIVQHLQSTLRDERPEQLLMIVRGEGGTGKTVLLNAISRSFATHDASHRLAKTATTGIAASLFGGQTLHSWAGIPISARGETWRTPTEKRKQAIEPVWYLVIDESSMLTKRIVNLLSQILTAVKVAAGQCDEVDAFGNINVILFGDLHQFPPVGSLKQALFYDDSDADTSSQLGLELYRQFTTVVTLREQRRVTDPVWMSLLGRLRTGDCTEEDIQVLQSLVVGSDDFVAPNWSSPPWDFPILVTPRHAVRIQWNTESLRKHCAKTGNHLYLCPAEDTVIGADRGLTARERLVVAGTKTRLSGKLSELVQLSIGMRAMVILNISTEADLANGTRGEVTRIVLDAKEPLPPEQDTTGAIRLRYPPALVLFKADTTDFPPFEGLAPGIIPIIPSSARFTIKTGAGKVSIRRRQFAMTAGYAFTDYKSQGQTIPHVLVDLGNPPTGTLTPFSAYVALSRSHGRENIRILRGFDPRLFTTHPSEKLRAEDARLDSLTVETTRMFPSNEP